MPVTITDARRAYMAIEDDLALVRCAARVLDLAFASLEAHELGQSPEAQSLHFTARGIEAALDRIEQRLCPDVDASGARETEGEAA